MLNVLHDQTTAPNASAIQQQLSTLVDPILPWTASIIRSGSVHEELYQSVSRAFLQLTSFLTDKIGLRGFDDENKEYVEACKEMAKAYIDGHEATKLLLGQDTFPDVDRLRKRDRVRAITKAVRSRVILSKMGSPPKFAWSLHEVRNRHYDM